MDPTTWIADDDATILEDVGEVALPYNELAHWFLRVGTYSIVVLCGCIALSWWYYKDDILRVSGDQLQRVSERAFSAGERGEGGPRESRDKFDKDK